MGCYSNLVGFYSDLMEFDWYFNGIIVISWDIHGIYPLVNVYMAMENQDF